MPRPIPRAVPTPRLGPTPSVKPAVRTGVRPAVPRKLPGVLKAQFMIVDDFLPRHELDELTKYTLAHRVDFKRSEVVSPGEGESTVDYEFRRSQVLFNAGKHETRIVDRMKKYMPSILKRLAHKAFPLARVDAQITASNNGDFFKMHSDSGDRELSPREITFVYFFHREPKAFSGGELRIYDAKLENGDYVSTGKYQSIIPKRNRIVFLPSEHLHEVTPVRCPSRAFADSRFTFNGWFLRK
jgi:Rps23 Pro-64 3,4-dihydroxylase Tpa1-like proline 4-hydroxylase